MIAHWDDVAVVRREEGHICGDWQYLTGDASVTVGARRLRVPAGSWSTPLHLEGSEEEIFFVLGGSVTQLWDVPLDRLRHVRAQVSEYRRRGRAGEIPTVLCDDPDEGLARSGGRHLDLAHLDDVLRLAEPADPHCSHDIALMVGGRY